MLSSIRFWCSFVLISKFSLCFNIDTNFPIVYSDPSEYLRLSSTSKSSYFGYSLVLYPGNNRKAPWILIGAPRGQGLDVSVKNPGVCFECGIGDPCSLRHIRDRAGTLPNNEKEKVDDAWFGGSMDISHELERVVVCAYRWINIVKKYNKASRILYDDYYMRGSCYWFHIDDPTNTTQRLIPLTGEGRDTYADNTVYVYDYAQGQGGFSVHMPQKEASLLLGAPGVLNWHGTSLLYKDQNGVSPEASKLRLRKRYADPSEYASKNVANAVKITQTRSYNLLGYSSTSGYFYGNKTLYYVSGAPKEDNYNGRVLIYHFDKVKDAALKVRETVSGYQFAEYFGAALTAGDLNNDGFDDLIVGAPFHKTERYNEGKIYIFMGNTKSVSGNNPIGIVGKSTNGQFGTFVQYLGDINSDGFGDLAVSAPYEDGKSGVLYLYRGTRTGIDTTYVQRIVGKDIYPEIRGFGISISRPADIDGNKYSDVAIGAHISGHAVLLRTRPTVTIHHKLDSFSSGLDLKQASFKMKACFWYELNQMDVSIKIHRIISVDDQLGRAKLSNGNKYNETIELEANKTICQNLTILLQKSFLDKYHPISVSLAHEFITPPNEEFKEVTYVAGTKTGTDGFCPRCPVYDKYRSSQPVTKEIPFVLNCGSDNKCIASIDFEPTITGIDDDNSFVLGSKDHIQLRTLIHNSGENAYLTQLSVTVPDMVTFQRTTSGCTKYNSSSLICNVDNPLQSNDQKNVALDLDMTNVNSGKYDGPLTITITVLTSSENDRENKKELTLKLRREADVTITGKSTEQSYSFKNTSHESPNFTQIYQVEKFGSSPLNEILIEIDIPHALQTKDRVINFISLYPVKGTIQNREIMCSGNFSYIDVSSGEQFISDEGISDEKEGKRRSVRQVEVFNVSTATKQNLIKENEFDQLQNRTFYINCSVPEVVCSKLSCRASSIQSGQIVNIRTKMFFNISAIKNLLNKKDVILFTTHGNVKVINPSNFMQGGNKPDFTEVSSLFLGDGIEAEIEYWIIIVAVVAGLLILLLLILGLIKAGFFKRARKEELAQLKKEAEAQDNDNVNLTYETDEEP